MARLLRSFFYKLFRDWTFRIVGIIGVALAIVLGLIYGLLVKGPAASGAFGLLSSISPSQNYGIVVPINLAIFVTLLFSQGIIRNEIIVGNSKVKIYFTLLIGGLAFALGLMIVYVGLSVGVLSIISGGFYTSAFPEAKFSIETVFRVIILAIINYTLITSFAVFISSSIRNQGASISLVVIPVVILTVFSMIVVLGSEFNTGSGGVPDWLVQVNKYINPQYALGKVSGSSTVISQLSQDKSILSHQDFIIGIVNNLVYTALFTTLGAIIFKHSDVK